MSLGNYLPCLSMFCGRIDTSIKKEKDLNKDIDIKNLPPSGSSLILTPLYV